MAIAALVLSCALLLPCLAGAVGSTIRGRVTDQAGRPMPGVQVSAYPSSAGALSRACEVATSTDESGRFLLEGLFDGVLYHVSVHRKRGGHGFSAFAGQREELAISLEVDREQEKRTTKPRAWRRVTNLVVQVVDADHGKPVPGATVIATIGSAFGQHGFRDERQADREGKVKFESLPRPGARVHAQTEDRISPYAWIEDSKLITLALVPAARLEGAVTDKATGTPLAGCTVAAGAFETETDENGAYSFPALPPGKCDVRASCWGYTKISERLPLTAARESFFKIELDRKTTVRGRVLGPDGRPVPGAIVGKRSTEAVRTDENGNFEAFIDRVGRRKEEIHAYAGRLGYGSCAPIKLNRGEVHEGITIRLPGATRIWGTVTDPDGTPIPGVKLIHRPIITDDLGRFDTGWIRPRRRSAETITLFFQAPRPPNGEVGRGGGIRLYRHPPPPKAVQPPDPGERFWHHAQLELPAAPGIEQELHVVLEPAELVTFTGRVLDRHGVPATNVNVVLFAGNANEKALYRTLYPWMKFQEPSIRGEPPRSVALCRTATDEKGRFLISIVHESAQGIAVLARLTGRRASVDASRFSIGANLSNGQARLVHDLVLPEDVAHMEVDVRMPARGEGDGFWGSLVDQDGKPLAGIELRVGQRYQAHPVTTEADGGFLASMGTADHLMFTIQTEGWSFLEPRPYANNTHWLHLKDVADRTNDLRIVLARITGSVRGTVAWETGRPVVEFTVHAAAYRPRDVPARGGAFSLAGFPAGRHTIEVTTPASVRGRADVRVLPDAETAVKIVLPVPDCTIRGRALEEDGRPKTDLLIEVKGESYEIKVVPDKDGRFELAVPAGNHEVRALRLNWGGMAKISVTVSKDAPVANITFMAGGKDSKPRFIGPTARLEGVNRARGLAAYEERRR